MRKIVKPVGDLRVPDPYGRVVPEDGAIVLWSSWWQRRLKEGAITVHPVQEHAPKPRKKATKSTEETEK